MPRTTPPRALRAAALAAVLAAAAASAPSAMAAPSLTKVDISHATQSSVYSNFGSNSASTSDATYFVVPSGDHPGVYRTNGTAGGTTLVKAYADGQGDAAHLTAVGDRVFFTLDAGDGTQLWVSDGTTAGTTEVGSNPVTSYSKLASFAGKLYILGAADGSDTLWVTDGSADGVSAAPAMSGTTTIDFWADGGKLFLLGDQGDGRQLGVLSSDGSSASPVFYGSSSINPNRDYLQQSADGDLYFTLSGSSQLYVSDGTSEGTQQVQQDGDPYSIGGTFYGFVATGDGIAVQSYDVDDDDHYVQHLTHVVGGEAMEVTRDSNFGSVGSVGAPSTLVFTDVDSTHGTEVFTTDPESFSPRVIADVVPGSDQSGVTALGTAGGKYYFTESDANGALQLWSTTGEVGNAVQLSDVAGGIQVQGKVTALAGGGVLFAASDAAHGTEPWVAGSTAGSAHILKDLNTDLTDAQLGTSTEIAGKAWFTANDGIHGDEPWTSDGTAAGTHMLADLAPGTSGSSAANFAAVTAGKVAFTASSDQGFGGQAVGEGDVSASSADGTGVFVSDGTADGTSRLTGFSNATYLVAGAGGQAYFIANDDANDGQLSLWVTDGTQSGTHTVAVTLPDGAQASRLRYLTRAGDKVFGMLRYYADGQYRYRVFSIDASGSATVVPTDPGTYGSLTAVGDRVVFRGVSDDQGNEPWVSDGTAEGTHVLADAQPGPGGSYTYGYVANAGGVAYGAYTDNGAVLLNTAADGTTTQIAVPAGRSAGSAQLMSIGGKTVAYFGSGASEGAVGGVTHIDVSLPAGTELDVLGTDGTLSQLRDFPESNAEGGSLVEVGDKLAFVVGMTSGGSAVWTTDGTAAGTTLAADAYNGSTLNSAYVLGSAGGTLLFSGAVSPDARQLFLYGEAPATVVPTTPAATTPAPVTPGATTPEAAAPVATTPAPAPAASAPAPAPKPVAPALVPREVAKKLTTGVKLKGDDTYKVSGKLSLPKGSKGKCEGTVTLKVYAGSKLIATFHAPVKAAKDGCTYSKVFTLSDKAAAVAGKRTVKVTFNASSTVHVKHGAATTLPRS